MKNNEPNPKNSSVEKFDSKSMFKDPFSAAGFSPDNEATQNETEARDFILSRLAKLSPPAQKLIGTPSNAINLFGEFGSAPFSDPSPKTKLDIKLIQPHPNAEGLQLSSVFENILHPIKQIKDLNNISEALKIPTFGSIITGEYINNLYTKNSLTSDLSLDNTKNISLNAKDVMAAFKAVNPEITISIDVAKALSKDITKLFTNLAKINPVISKISTIDDTLTGLRDVYNSGITNKGTSTILEKIVTNIVESAKQNSANYEKSLASVEVSF